jgi:hypothetical protein
MVGLLQNLETYTIINMNNKKRRGKMEKDNSLLFKGMLLLGVGLILFGYSVSSWLEVKNFAKNVDFELVDENVELSSEDKYYKYLAFSDYINQKLDKNKNLPIKNASCTYLNYAEHNTLEMYRLATLKLNDEAKRNTVNSNIRGIYNIIDSYSTCKVYPEYKAELKNLISEIEESANSNIDKEINMQKFLNGYKDKNSQNVEVQEIQGENVAQPQVPEQTESQVSQTPIQE